MRNAVQESLKKGNSWGSLGVCVYVNSCWRRVDPVTERRRYRFHANKECCMSSVSRRRGSGLAKDPAKAVVKMWLEKAVDRDMDVCHKCCDVSLSEIRMMEGGR